MLVLSPELSSVAALHAYLGIGKGEARFIARHVQNAYSIALIPKKRGGQRSLMVPDERLKFLQRKLLPLLNSLYKLKPSVHGFVFGRSAITNADAHQGRPYLLNIDIENYFGIISRNRVAGMLKAVGLSAAVADAVCDLTIVANQLPQGAPTSPILANMVTYRLDKDLIAYAKARKLRYTRYADDLTFSSWARPDSLFASREQESGGISIDALDPTLLGIILSNGFKLNPDKARWAGQKARKEVTGLVVNEFTNLRRTFIRDVRSSLYRLELLGLAAAEAEYKSRYGVTVSLRALISGKLTWIAQVRSRSFDPYRRLAAQYNKLFPDNLLPIDPTHEEIVSKATFILEYCGPGKDFGQGTAFFLEGVGLVTAYHVLEKMKKKWADLYRVDQPSKKFRARFSSRVCSHRDLAVLEHNIPTSEQTFIKKTTAEDRSRSSAIAVGFPEHGPGAGAVHKEGRIVGKGTRSAVKYIEVDMVMGDGFSGGPIINDRYEAVAVIHKGGPLETKQLGISVSEFDGF